MHIIAHVKIVRDWPHGHTQATVLTTLQERVALVSYRCCSSYRDTSLTQQAILHHRQGKSDPRLPSAKTDEIVRPMWLEKHFNTVWLSAQEQSQHPYM